MANERLGGFLSSLLTPYTSPTSTSSGAGVRTGQLMESMRSNRKQEGFEGRRQARADQYLDMQQTSMEEAKRQRAMERLQAALMNPEDSLELQTAASEAKRFGIDVSGIEKLLEQSSTKEAEVAVSPEAQTDTRTPQPEATAPVAQQASPQASVSMPPKSTVQDPNLDVGAALEDLDTLYPSLPEGAWMPGRAGEIGARSKDLGPTGLISTPAEILALQQGGGGGQATVTQDELRALQGSGQAAIAQGELPQPGPAGSTGSVITPDETQALQDAARAAPTSMALRPTSPAPGLEGDLPPVPDDNVVTITDNGRPVARIGARDLLDYRRRQAEKVGSVMQPFLENARSPSEQRAATVAMRTGVAAAAAGMGTDKAIEHATRAYNTELSRDAAGERASRHGGGGGGGGRNAYRDRSEERQDRRIDFQQSGDIIRRHMAQYKIAAINDGLEMTERSLAGIQSDDVVSQNTAVMDWMHERIGGAMTKHEIAGMTGGIDLVGKLQELKRTWVGGNRSKQVRVELARNLKMLQGVMRKKRAMAAESGYQSALTFGLDEHHAEGIYAELAGEDRPAHMPTGPRRKRPAAEGGNAAPKGEPSGEGRSAATKAALDLLEQ